MINEPKLPSLDDNKEKMDEIAREMEKSLKVLPGSGEEVEIELPNSDLVDPEEVLKSNRSSSRSEQELEYSDVEREAKSKGWIPKEEFTGDPSTFRSAKEFVERGELFDRISTQNKTIKQMEKAIQQLTGLVKKSRESDLKEREEWVKNQRRLAIEGGNVAEVEKFDKVLESTKEELNFTTKTMETDSNEGIKTSNVSVPPEAERFVRNNSSWFNDFSAENSEMKEFAIAKEKYLSQKYPDWSLATTLREVERSVRDMFPRRFVNTNRNRAPEVSAQYSENAIAKNSKQKMTYNQLPSDIKHVVKKMANMTGMTLDEYAQKLYESDPTLWR